MTLDSGGSVRTQLIGVTNGILDGAKKELGAGPARNSLQVRLYETFGAYTAAAIDRTAVPRR